LTGAGGELEGEPDSKDRSIGGKIDGANCLGRIADAIGVEGAVTGNHVEPAIGGPGDIGADLPSPGAAFDAKPLGRRVERKPPIRPRVDRDTAAEPRLDKATATACRKLVVTPARLVRVKVSVALGSA
jgi:hypothetical protein